MLLFLMFQILWTVSLHFSLPSQRSWKATTLFLVVSCTFGSGFNKNPKMRLNVEDKNEVEANILDMFIFCDGKTGLYTFEGSLQPPLRSLHQLPLCLETPAASPSGSFLILVFHLLTFIFRCVCQMSWLQFSVVGSKRMGVIPYCYLRTYPSVICDRNRLKPPV